MTRRHRMATTLTALAAVCAGPSAALADQPLVEVPARFTETQAGGLTPNAAGASITGARDAGGGSWAALGWCTPYAGSHIEGFTYLLGAWHANLGDGAIIQEQTDAGTYRTYGDGSLPRQAANGFGPWPTGISPSHCVGVKIVARVKLPTAAAWTVDLRSVMLRDLVGPRVGAVATQPGWLTGDTVEFGVDQGDNGLSRGTLRAWLDDRPPVELGDPGDSRVGGHLNTEGMADGAHTVTVQRTAPGWAPAAAAASFHVDRTPPAVPGLSSENDRWTNAPSVEVRSGPSWDGSGSGWSRNQFSVDGGGWRDGTNTFLIETQGVHVVRARAVDNAGHVSGEPSPVAVRIDRGVPSIGTLSVAKDGPPAFVLKASDSLSGLDECQAEVTLRTPVGADALLYSGPSGSLAGDTTMPLPMAGRPAGPYSLVATVCDRAGNAARRTTSFNWTPPAPPSRDGGASSYGGAGLPAGGGTGSGGGAPAAKGSITNVVTSPSVAVPSAPGRVAAGGRARWWRPIVVRGRVGRRAVVRGRVMIGARPAPRGMRVTVRDAVGIAIARGRVRADGVVIIRVRLAQRGALSIGVGGATLRVPVRAR